MYDEQALLVYIKLSDNEIGTDLESEAIYALKERLVKIVENSTKGQFDEHEFGGGFCTFFIYGPNTDDLFETIMPAITNETLTYGSYLVKRYGKPGAKQEIIDLNWRKI